MSDAPLCRLAVYGSLAPGEANHAVIAPVHGTWHRGWVRGRLSPAGWGQTHGYPGIVCDPGGDRVPVRMLEATDLPKHWARLDTFEGPDYRRVVVSVELDSGRRTTAYIYEVAIPGQNLPGG